MVLSVVDSSSENKTSVASNTETSAVDLGKKVVRIEANALYDLESRIGDDFEVAVKLILECSGRVIVSGIGKSGLIARKIVATMNSIGTPSIFLHPSDAIHGDLGMVRIEDVVLLISKSGNTEELKGILPIFKRIGVRIISIVGNLTSYLAEQSDIALDGSVIEEACPYDIVPTASTTVALALGDALAVTLLQKRGFTLEDFAFYHPGGTLGKRLLLNIQEVMTKNTDMPIVHQSITLKDAILEMTSKRLGATCVVDDNQALAGIITDGDLRRLLERDTDIKNLLAYDVMNAAPKTITPLTLATVALEIMEHHKIMQLIVVDQEKHPIGIVHMHTLVQLGLR